MKKLINHVVFFSILYVLLFPQRAHAYLDPGTGSYILQMVAAVFFAGLFLTKTWWTQIKHIISKLTGKKDHDSDKNSTKKN